MPQRKRWTRDMYHVGFSDWRGGDHARLFGRGGGRKQRQTPCWNVPGGRDGASWWYVEGGRKGEPCWNVGGMGGVVGEGWLRVRLPQSEEETADITSDRNWGEGRGGGGEASE